jgi:Histidinol phosphatase and related hydrolases of the PHP family
MYKIDPHTHSLVSGHAYNTIKEMAEAACKKGMEVLGITEHGPKMITLTTDEYFMNFMAIDRNSYGTHLLMGAEANIIDYDGNLDLPDYILENLDIVITSMHWQCYTAGSRKENTKAAIKAIEKPYTVIMGHPDDGKFPLDYEEVVKAAKENNVLLEVNNGSLLPKSFRKDGKKHCIEMLNECERQHAHIVVSSDAHSDTAVGEVSYAERLLHDMQFSKELIVNEDRMKFDSFLKRL